MRARTDPETVATAYVYSQQSDMPNDSVVDRSLTAQASHLKMLLEMAGRFVDSDASTAKSLIAEAHCIIHGTLTPQSRKRSKSRGGLSGWQIAKAKNFISQNLGRRIVIDDLSALMGLSPAYFSRAFKQSFGDSPHSFIVRRRLAHARELLLNTRLPLCEVAIDCGFADQAHLSRHFRRHFGVPPAGWRRRQISRPTRDNATEQPDHL
ncbi:helix-turn-helix domain-containing protein [Tardiphaga alba]|nr:AraC family transcriptional regulator [Tardiphaga alba]